MVRMVLFLFVKVMMIVYSLNLVSDNPYSRRYCGIIKSSDKSMRVSVHWCSCPCLGNQLFRFIAQVEDIKTPSHVGPRRHGLVKC